MSKLGERPSEEEQQLKVMHGICRENSAKQNRAAENHPASERLNLILRQSAASLPRAGHTAAAKTRPRALGAERRRPQRMKCPLHEISAKAGHEEGVHLPGTSRLSQS